MFTKADAEAYFTGEKIESLVFVLLGITAIVVALAFWFWLKTPLHKGAAVPILVVGLLQLTVGYTVYSRSDAQRKDIVYKMDLNPDAIATQEIPRMEKVMRNFVVYRWTEIVLLLVALVGIFILRNQPDKLMLYGVALGLAVQAAISLAADYTAEKRGAAYLNGLKQFVQQTKRMP